MNGQAGPGAGGIYRDRFFDSGGEPRLWPCAVLFLDLLSVSALAEGERGNDELRRFRRALRRTFDTMLQADSPWPAAAFSDSIVVAAPLDTADSVDPAEETAIGGLLTQAAYLQLGLLSEGLVARGGLAVGELHLSDGLLFGPALVWAYELESKVAVNPRVVVAADLEPYIARALDYYADPKMDAPQNFELLRDADGRLFVDYLGLLFDEIDDPVSGLLEHRDLVLSALEDTRAQPGVFSKYRWMADYHDAVCHRYASVLGAEGPGLLVGAEPTRTAFSTLLP